MRSYQYIEDFEKLGFGLFVHFGLYSVQAQGEWYLSTVLYDEKQVAKYNDLANKFVISKNWARDLVSTAKKAGCKYITLTTRHHDGFSLFDTCGLNEFDAPHSACKRDLVREFVNECNKQGIVPFFYHTLLDWWNPDYKNNFDAYIEYLIKSVEILCTNYGKIGGLWFDGFWDKPDANWRFDRLYATIRKHQPEAMIINNTGLSALGKVSHPEIDSVTFERGKPCFVDNSDRPRAGEMCEVICDHWGYAKNDIAFKSVKQLLETLITCRSYNCNLLLNAGPRGNGLLMPLDKHVLESIGLWIKANKKFIYNAKSCDLTAENAVIVKDEKYYYAIVSNVPMSADPNVAKAQEGRVVTVNTNKKLKGAIWLDSGEKVALESKNSFVPRAFSYGSSLYMRVARFTL